MTARVSRAASTHSTGTFRGKLRRTSAAARQPVMSQREVSAARIAGYYTLAAAGIPLADMPAELAKRLPRYPSVPVARLGRLAVDQAYRGRKLGSALLWDAVQRCLRSELAVFALVVDAKDDQAETFYRHHGFVPFGSQPRQLVLPLTNLIVKE